MRDRTTKALLVLVALGLWANVASRWVQATEVPLSEFLAKVESSGGSHSPLIAEQAYAVTQGVVPAIPRGTQRPEGQVIRPGEPFGEVITGTNLGFQPVVSSGQHRANQVPGYLVVKVNGEWKQVTGTPVVVPAGSN
jgi:hypothetical protein